MNRLSIFLVRHSQKLALCCTIGAAVSTYFVQPYIEVLNRWSISKFGIDGEVKPATRITELTDEVCRKFDLKDEQRLKLDIFTLPLDEPVTLGSLRSSGYAFIGIPYFFGYRNTAEIALDTLDFYRPYFPYGPYSKLGQKRIELMVLPDSALRFLLAREIIRLGGVTVNGKKLLTSARTESILTASGVIGSLYLSYQIIYFFNRVTDSLMRWSRPTRLLGYTFLPLLGLFCQYQCMLVWRRHRCLKADQIAASLDESFRQGGQTYYEWRLKWNKFWAMCLQEFKQMQTKPIGTGTSKELDSVLQHQLENKSSAEADEGYQRQDYYYPPTEQTPYVQSDSSSVTEAGTIPKPTLRYYRNDRFSSSGNELWAGDGDGIGFGLTGILTTGLTPFWFSGLLNIFSNPATSEQRITFLKSAAT